MILFGAMRQAQKLTTIQITPDTRDRLYRLKFRKTYEEFLREVCDRLEREEHRASAE